MGCLSRPAAAAADDVGWQYVLAAFQVAVPVPLVSAGVEVIAAAVRAAGADADGHLRANLRVDRVEFTVRDLAQTGVNNPFRRGRLDRVRRAAALRRSGGRGRRRLESGHSVGSRTAGTRFWPDRLLGWFRSGIAS